MSDALTPDESATTDAPTADDLRPQPPLDVTEVQEEAKKSFSLRDRVLGISPATAKVLIFTDPQAVIDYRALDDKAQALVDRAAKTDITKEKAVHDSLVAEYTALEEGALEAAKQKMLQSALAIHLRGYPQVSIKVARREARKRFVDKATGDVPLEMAEESQNWVEARLLSDSIVKIVDAEGNNLELDMPRDEVGAFLMDFLPASEWPRVIEAFRRLQISGMMAAAATDDAGF